MSAFTESVVEEAALGWLESLGYTVKHGLDIAPGELGAERTDYGQVVLERRLRDALARLNPDLPPEAMDGAFRKVLRAEGATLETRNRAMHRMLVDGVTVEYQRQDGSIAGAQAQLVDFDAPENNDWLAVNQVTVTENLPAAAGAAQAGKHTRRPDVVLFVNGLPLGAIELKNPADENTTMWTAFQQLQTYKQEIPALFTLNEVLVVSDGVEARLGTLTAGREWMKPWRTVTGEALADPLVPELQVLIEGVFEQHRFLELIRSCIVFEDWGGGKLAKIMAGYHQFHAVNIALEETLRASHVPSSGTRRGRARA